MSQIYIGYVLWHISKFLTFGTTFPLYPGAMYRLVPLCILSCNKSLPPTLTPDNPPWRKTLGWSKTVTIKIILQHRHYFGSIAVIRSSILEGDLWLVLQFWKEICDSFFNFFRDNFKIGLIIEGAPQLWKYSMPTTFQTIMYPIPEVGTDGEYASRRDR